MIAKTKAFFKEVLRLTQIPEMLILPGQLSYFFVLAIFPTITLISFFLAYFKFPGDVFYNFLSSAFSPSLANYLISSSLIVKTKNVQSIFITVFALFLSSNGAASIITTSNMIYGVENKNFIRRRVKAIIMILTLLIIFLFMLLIPMYGNQVILLIESLSIKQSIITKIVYFINLLQGPLAWFIIFVFIKLIYTIAPDKKVSSKSVNKGAIFTTTGWILITWGYSYYINNFADYSVLYGSLANVVILLLWFYFISVVFTLGMAFNQGNELETSKA